MKETKPRPATAQWGMFLRNHDELDLGRLTGAAAASVFDAFGPDKNMQLYDRGIRRRLAPMLDGDRRRLELAYSLMFTLPGTPVMRYGDEIGMGDDLQPAGAQLRPHADAVVDRAARRLHQGDKPVLPVISGGPYGFEHVNVGRAAARSGLDAELDRADDPHAQGGAGDRLGRLHRAGYAATRRCWRCATTGATIPSSSSTISTPSRSRSRSISAGRASAAR